MFDTQQLVIPIIDKVIKLNRLPKRTSRTRAVTVYKAEDTPIKTPIWTGFHFRGGLWILNKSGISLPTNAAKYIKKAMQHNLIMMPLRPLWKKISKTVR